MTENWSLIFFSIVLLLVSCGTFFSVYWELIGSCHVQLLVSWTRGEVLSVAVGVGVWGAAPACLMWCIWRERNHCTFEGMELSMLNLKFLFLKSLYERCSVSPFSTESFMDFLSDLCIVGYVLFSF